MRPDRFVDPLATRRFPIEGWGPRTPHDMSYPRRAEGSALLQECLELVRERLGGAFCRRGDAAARPELGRQPARSVRETPELRVRVHAALRSRKTLGELAAELGWCAPRLPDGVPYPGVV